MFMKCSSDDDPSKLFRPLPSSASDEELLQKDVYIPSYVCIGHTASNVSMYNVHYRREHPLTASLAVILAVARTVNLLSNHGSLDRNGRTRHQMSRKTTGRSHTCSSPGAFLWGCAMTWLGANRTLAGLAESPDALTCRTFG